MTGRFLERIQLPVFLGGPGRGYDSLPTNRSDADIDLEREARGHGRTARRSRRTVCSIVAAVVFAVLVLGGLYAPTRLPPAEEDTPIPPPSNNHETIPSHTPPPVVTKPPSSLARLEAEARAGVDALLARQSKTLAQARARYTLKTTRQPPEGYDQFYQYAKEHHCLIDDYDRVHADFRPFYQLAETHPGFFRTMVEKGMQLGKVEDKRLTTFTVNKEGPLRDHSFYSPFAGEWGDALRLVAPHVPPFSAVFNYQDEPRVLFDTRLPAARENALNITDDKDPFSHKPKPTSLDLDTKCPVPNEKGGFGSLTNKVNGFLIDSASSGFTMDLYPVLSQTKISPCFSDILIPSMYYYTRSWWAPKFDHLDQTSWEAKKEKLYWRGGTSGGMLVDQNYHNFPRFRFVDMAENRTDIIDAKFTVLAEPNCHEGCPGDEIKDRYKIHEKADPTEAFAFKYLFDIDGNSFSGRYFGLLRSNSLVFKSTIFSEFFDGWLKPYVHYIPVLPDLSDLVEKVEWAMKNDEEAHRIQLAGKDLLTRVVTDEQNDCYYYAVFLEYSRLQQYSREVAVKRGWI